MIVGLGIDVEKVARFAELLARWGARIEQRLFTAAERAYCAARGQPAQHFAARFAAKEATLRAQGVPPGLSWHEMEVVSGSGGAPSLVLLGEARRAADARGVARVHVSLTHTDETVAAVVVLEAS